MNVIQFLSGKKTYLTGAIALVLVFGSWQSWWTIPTQAYETLMALALIFLRAGVAKRPQTPDPDLQPAARAASSKLPPLMLAFACLIGVCATGLFVSGCSTTAQQAAYQAAGSTQVSVDTAMNLWGTYVAQSHPPISQEQAVAGAYAKYQTAMAAVCDAGAVYSAAASSTNAPAASVALQTAIANANQEILDLDNLISSFGVNLNTTNAP